MLGFENATDVVVDWEEDQIWVWVLVVSLGTYFFLGTEKYLRMNLIVIFDLFSLVSSDKIHGNGLKVHQEFCVGH